MDFKELFQRIRRGRRQQDLADELGVHQATISTWEQGEGLNGENVALITAHYPEIAEELNALLLQRRQERTSSQTAREVHAD